MHPFLIEAMCVLVPVRAYVLCVHLWRVLREDMPGQRAQWVRWWGVKWWWWWGGGFKERPATLDNSRPPVSQSFSTQMHTVTHTCTKRSHSIPAVLGPVSSFLP